ncbi:MAG TPA: TRAP transporter small permease [Dehalococcoidales bacterium]
MIKKLFLAIDRVIERVADWGLISSGVLILIMGFLSTYAVGRRYVLHSPEPYSYELSTILLLSCVVLAVSGLQRHYRHLRVDFIANYLPPIIQLILIDIVGPLLALAYVSIIVWQSWGNAAYSFSIGETSQSVWQEPLFPTKFVVPLGMGWLCLVLVAQLWKGIANITKSARAKPAKLPEAAPE